MKSLYLSRTHLIQLALIILIFSLKNVQAHGAGTVEEDKPMSLGQFLLMASIIVLLLGGLGIVIEKLQPEKKIIERKTLMSLLTVVLVGNLSVFFVFFVEV